MPPEPPPNGEYLIAAYVIASVILVVYWLALWSRAGRGTKNVSGRKGT